jgi:hypothetical protein
MGRPSIFRRWIRAAKLLFLLLALPVLGAAAVLTLPSAHGQASSDHAPDKDNGEVSVLEFFASAYSYTVPAVRATYNEQYAFAMDIDQSELYSVVLQSGNADNLAIVGRVPGTWFPTRGHTFLLMSTGSVSATSFISGANSLNPMHEASASDMGGGRVQLQLRLTVPKDVHCAGFDYAFYSRNLNRFDDPRYNDFFVAQVNTNTILYEPRDNGFNLIAPTNFALDRNHNPISVNNVYSNHIRLNPDPPNGIVSPILRARVPVTPHTSLLLYLTIQDVGDELGNSAVAIDNFSWEKTEACETGLSGDTDGDGLPDGWETYGIFIGGVMPMHIDLPGEGANPLKRDVFVEIDYMAINRRGIWISHEPTEMIVNRVVKAFRNAPIVYTMTTTAGMTTAAGIQLHVDYKNEGRKVSFQEYIGTCPERTEFDWTNFDRIKAKNLKPGRAVIYHYSVWADMLCEAYPSTSGKSRNLDEPWFNRGASDFIVSMGHETWIANQTRLELQYAGTFMHELGHNLGLKHGGHDHYFAKPNHLSIMNQQFQTTGLTRNYSDGYLDYSRYTLPVLDPTNLDESRGLYMLGVHADVILGTSYWCKTPKKHFWRRIDDASRAIDWNCDFSIEDMTNGQPISTTIMAAKDCGEENCLGPYETVNEWEILSYTGGLLTRDHNVLLPEAGVVDSQESMDGPSQGDNRTLPRITRSIEITKPLGIDTVEPIPEQTE